MKDNFNVQKIQIYLGCIIILVAGFLLTQNLQDVMDIFFLDESNYLNRGINFFKRMSKEWAPLYSGWYRFLYFFEKDSFNLFYLNFKLLSVLPFVFFYLLLIKQKYPAIISLLISIFFMSSLYNLPNNPKVSHFTILIIFAVLYFLPTKISLFNKFLTLIFSAFILSYARPEMYLSSLIFIGILVLLIIAKKVDFKLADKKLLKIFLVVAIVFHVFWGAPLGAKIKGSSRSLIAFGEHFSYNYSQWNEIDQYLWLKQDVILQEHFGDVKSLSGVIKSNPILFKKHISTNSMEFVKAIKLFFIDTLGFHNTNRNIVKLIFSILFFLVIISSRLWIKNQNKEREVLVERGFILMALFVFMLPSLVSSIIIYPREHYIIHQIPFYLSLIIFVFVPAPVMPIRLSKLNFSLFISVGVFVILLIPKAGDYAYFTMRKDEKVLNNQIALTLLTKLEIEDTVKILNFEGDFNFIIGRNYRWVKPNEKRDIDFFKFLEATNPEIIYCTLTSFKNPWYDDDISWHNFTSNPIEYNYVRVDLGDNVEEYFLFREDFYLKNKEKIISNPEPYSKLKR